MVAVGKAIRIRRGWSLPVLALGVVVQLALDHVNHDLVADKTTLVHDLLSLLAELGLLRDL